MFYLQMKSSVHGHIIAELGGTDWLARSGSFERLVGLSSAPAEGDCLWRGLEVQAVGATLLALNDQGAPEVGSLESIPQSAALTAEFFEDMVLHDIR